MGFLKTLFTRNDDNADWRNLSALPSEIVSKEELDALQKEVVSELEQVQKTVTDQTGEQAVAKPQTLFYYHKYIDAKFNKGNFNIDTYFAHKQNVIDHKYAEGLGDIKAQFTGYQELINEINEVDQRLRRKIKHLDPASNVSFEEASTYDDAAEILAQINQLPEEINWDNLEGVTR